MMNKLLKFIFSLFAPVLSKVEGEAPARKPAPNDAIESAELRRIYDALVASEQRYALVAQGAGDGVWDWDIVADNLYLSPRLLALLGYEPDFITRVSAWRALVHPDDSAASHRKLIAHLKGDSDYFESEFRVKCGDGRYRWLADRGMAARDATGRAVRMGGSIRDITESKRAETQLRESESRLRLITENVPAMIAQFDHDCRFTFINRRYAETFGRAPAQLIGRHVREIVGDAAFAEVEARFESVLSGNTTTYNREVLLPDDRRRHFEVTLVPDRRENDDIRGSFSLVLDITERKQAEDALRQSQQVLDAFFSQSLVGFFIMMLDEPIEWPADADNAALLEHVLDHERMTRVNSAMCGMYRVPLSRLLGRTPREIFEHDPDFAKSAWHDMFEYGHTMTETRHCLEDGAFIWIEGDYICLHDEAGRITGHFGAEREITSRKKAEAALRGSEQRFRDVVNAGGEYVWETDTRQRYTYVSDQFEAMMGYSPAEALGRTPFDFMSADEAERVKNWFQERSHARGKLFRGLEHRSISKSGALVWQQVSGVPAHDEQGNFTGYRGTGRDITERKLAEERIEHLATRDALTGLPNRLLLNDRLEHALAAAQRNAEMVAVLFIDLDRFKTINDSLGHHVGDELLRQATQRLALCVRKEDTLSRLGGDEFVAALSGLRETQDAAVVAKKILQALAQPYAIENHMLSASCSIGISIYPNDGQEVSVLTRNADTAMYHAKENGRNNYQFFSHDMNVRVVERLDLENALRLGIERQEFVLHYQPQVEIVSGKVVGAEALIRWQRPGNGLVFPNTFIQVAEESGLIAPIGEWVLATACAQGRAWADAGLRVPHISVNLSTRQVNRELAKTVGAILKTSGLNPDRLNLEITESLLMHNIEDTIVALQDLHLLGVKISIDDFGTGYSSLSYLRRLPIDVLKVDYSFVRDLGVSRDAAAIVSAIIAMAKSLQLRIIAEGVETPHQLEMLQEMHCNEYQGYLFGKPVPAEEFARRFLSSTATSKP